jgi:hypothetical protein
VVVSSEKRESEPEPVTVVVTTGKCELELRPQPEPQVQVPQSAIVSAPPAVEATGELAMYSAAWSTGGVSRQKTNIRMCVQDCPIFYAAKTSDKQFGATWVVSESVSKDATACARLHNHARRFWMKTDQTELFGLHFYDVNRKRNAPRAFHLALPNTTPYVAATREAELSRIAKTGFNGKDVEMFTTKQPTIGSNGAVVLKFGNGFVVTSIKNFIIEDENGQTVFMIYKSSSSTCTVKAKLPVTPLMAFGIATAIITSDR